MGISATYIGVIILLLILIGFVLSVIRSLGAAAGSRIRHDMNRVLSSYDYIINSKMNTLKENQSVKKVVNKNVVAKTNDANISKPNTYVIKDNTGLPSSFIKNEASHRDSSLVGGYDSIKNEFRSFGENINEKFKNIFDDIKPTKFEESVLKLSNELSIDTIYELCLYSPKEQLDFFENTLVDDDKEVFHYYLDTITNTFSTIEFYDWLRNFALNIPKDYVIRTSESNNTSNYEPSICEGVQIVTGNRLYDFSISKRDIRWTITLMKQ